jgi:predicted mannosyl-3-phosphoglycerate phosphatase (HAD superfamily)
MFFGHTFIPMKIFLDFDGTVVEHHYPQMGRYNPGCFEVLQKLQAAGHEIILNTYRADCNDGTLELAFQFLNSQLGFANNPILQRTEKKIYPPSWNWDYFFDNEVIFIDDISSGIPLIPTVELINSNMVDWAAVDKQFSEKGIYRPA